MTKYQLELLATLIAASLIILVMGILGCKDMAADVRAVLITVFVFNGLMLMLICDTWPTDTNHPVEQTKLTEDDEEGHYT